MIHEFMSLPSVPLDPDFAYCKCGEWHWDDSLTITAVESFKQHIRDLVMRMPPRRGRARNPIR